MNLPEVIRRWLELHRGLDLETLGDALLTKALSSRMRETLSLDEADYLRLWDSNALEKERFLKELLVGETWFFREWPAFEVMGDFIQARREQWCLDQPLRILSLPASTGEEPWSIAAICQRLGLSHPNVHIDALDINPAALDVAKRGLYAQTRFKARSPDDWPEAFEALVQDERPVWRVREGLRAMVAFHVQNALSSEFLEAQTGYHLIFLRNLLIYLNPTARVRLLEKLGQRLLPGGLIFLGHAEVFPVGSAFKRVGRQGAFAWRQEPPMRSAHEPKAKPSGALAKKRYPAPKGALQDPNRSKPPVPQAGLRSERVNGNPNESDLDEARRLADVGDYRAALNVLDGAQLQQATRPDVHCLAGILYSALGMGQEAIRRFRRALYLDPHHAESLFHLALVLEGRGESQAAERLRVRMQSSMESLS